MKTTLVTNILLDERLEYCRSGIRVSNFLSPYKMDIWECQINFTNGDVWVESCSCRLDFAQMYQVGRNEHYLVFFLLHVLRIIVYKFQIDLKLFFFPYFQNLNVPLSSLDHNVSTSVTVRPRVIRTQGCAGGNAVRAPAKCGMVPLVSLVSHSFIDFTRQTTYITLFTELLNYCLKLLITK